jgi:hypothetical protein
MIHKFKIGQLVRYRSNGNKERISRGIYCITILLPSREASDEAEYLIRNSIEGYERLAKESELSHSQQSEPNVRNPTKRGGSSY